MHAELPEIAQAHLRLDSLTTLPELLSQSALPWGAPLHEALDEGLTEA